MNAEAGVDQAPCCVGIGLESGQASVTRRARAEGGCVKEQDNDRDRADQLLPNLADVAQLSDGC
jgi:hypothetical protein